MIDYRDLYIGQKLYYTNKFTGEPEFVEIINFYKDCFICRLPDGRRARVKTSVIGERLFTSRPKLPDEEGNDVFEKLSKPYYRDRSCTECLKRRNGTCYYISGNVCDEFIYGGDVLETHRID